MRTLVSFCCSHAINKQTIHLTKHLTAMRTVHLIVIHCSATKENETLTEIELEKSHRQRGLNGIGYHYYIRRDGNIKSTRSVRKPGAHAQGHIFFTYI